MRWQWVGLKKWSVLLLFDLVCVLLSCFLWLGWFLMRWHCFPQPTSKGGASKDEASSRGGYLHPKLRHARVNKYLKECHFGEAWARVKGVRL